MALDSSVFGSGDPEQITQDIYNHYQPDDGQAFSSDTGDLSTRLARKLSGQQFKGVDFAKVAEKPKKETSDAPDLSSFGEEAPQPSSEDLSSVGEPPPTPPQPSLGVSGNLAAAGKGLVRGAPMAVASMAQGAAIPAGPLKPERGEVGPLVDELSAVPGMTPGERAKLVGRALRTIGDRGLQMDFNGAVQRIARGGDPDSEIKTIKGKLGTINADQDQPIEDQAKYKTAKAMKDWVDKTVPMTDQEKSSIGGQVGTGISSMVPYLAAGVIAGPEAGMILGAAGMGAQTAGDTFQAAKAKGATDDQAATAAGWSGAIGAALGSLQLGAVFAPVTQAAPGMKAWLTAKLVQAAQSGTVFATVGEAQEFLLQQVAKEQYDPKAGYSPEAKRVIAGLLTGGFLGALHPLSPKASDLSSPEAVADFIRKASATGRTPEEDAAAARGAQTRSEIDDFLRQKDAQEAANAPALPKPDEGTPQSPSAPEPGPTPSPSGGEAETPVASTEQTETEGLKRHGWSDDEIEAMSPATRREFFQQAMAGEQPEKPATKSDVGNEPANPTPGTREAPIVPETGADVFNAQAAEPTDAQAKAENYKHAHMELPHLGLVGKNSISIETGAGQTRRSVDDDGTVHENTLPFPYGRIKGTKGADGEPLDITIGPNPKSPHVFVIDQHHNDGSGFDEHKIMAGFDTPQEALVAYGAAYDDLGGNRIGHVTAMTPEQFDEWRKGDTTQPLKKSLSEKEIGDIFDEMVGTDDTKGTRGPNQETIATSSEAPTSKVRAETGRAPAEKGGEPESREMEAGSPQLPYARSDGGPSPRHTGAERPVGNEQAAAEVIPPGRLDAIEPTQKHHDQIEAVLGADYHHVLPVDIQRAAEIMASHDGITPQLAFQYAVIESAAQQKFLTPEQLEQVYGPQVKALLEPGGEGSHLGGTPVEQNSTIADQKRTSGGEESGELPSSGESGERERAENPAVENAEQHDAGREKPNAGRKARNRADQGATAEEGRSEGADESLWSLANAADNALSGNGARVIDRWVGGGPGAAKAGATHGIFSWELLEEAMATNGQVAKDIATAFAPVKAKLRELYGDSITLHRYERAKEQPPGRTLYSYTLDQRGMEHYANAPKERPLYTEDEIKALEKTFAETGEVKIPRSPYSLERQPDGGIFIMDPNVGGMVTDTDSVRAFMDERNDVIRESNEKRAKALEGAKTETIPLDQIVWVTDRFNQQEFIVRKASPAEGADQSNTGRQRVTSQWKEIGTNAAGNKVYEDQRGVRSYTENGVRVTEPVGVRPTKSGVEIEKRERSSEFEPAEKTRLEETVERARASAKATNDKEAEREKKAFAGYLVDAFTDRLKGEGFKNILDARRLGKEHGVDDVKSVEEALELAVVKAAREIVETSKEPYPELVKLYGKQPKLGMRTSTSVRDQAYSTPVPLAYVADRLADITKETTVYEPTAGNGALLLTADPAKVTANELNPERAKNLIAQGFKTREGDALTKNTITRVDRVIANPPFGAVKENGESKVFDMSNIQPGYKTHEIDHAIALRALDAMKDDGKAVLILGGLNKQLTTQESRSAGYNGKAKREFYKTLYDNYNVTDHFTVAGELYERQGAGWPVDVLVINGRGKSARALPAVDVPRIYDSWEALGGLLHGRENPENDAALERPAGGAPEERPGLAGNGGPDRGIAGERGSESGRGPGARAGSLRAKPVRGQPETVPAGGNGAEEPRGPVPDRQPVRSGEQPAAERSPSRLSADEIGDIFDNLVDERPTKEVATSAVKNAASAADEALSGLTALFGGNKLGSGPSFDEETYAKAKPMFISAAEKFADFKHDIRELMRRMLDHLKDAYKWTTDMLRNARPYVVKFMQDVQDGAVNLLKPAEAPKAKRPSTAVETEGQSVYHPKSENPGLDTLVPVNMKKSIADALTGLEKRAGPIDDFVAKELGYDKPDLEKYFGAEQVDALGLAIDNLNEGKGFIIGDQCVAGETLIYDPLFDCHVRIDELADASMPHAVLALTADGFAPHAAVLTFKKGRADLYRVTLEDGRSITVTRQHRFLTPVGWASIEDGVCSGTLLATAQGADTNALATHGAYGQRESRKPQDCLDRCSTDPYPCDGQPRTDAGIDPIVAQLRDDALEHIRFSSHRGDQTFSPERSGHDPYYGLHSKRSLSPSESRARDASEACASSFDEQSMGRKLQSAPLFGQSSAFCYVEGGEVLECSPSPAACSCSSDDELRQHISGGSKWSPPSPYGASPVLAPSAPSGSRARLLPAWSPVRSIEFVRFDDFYDLYVPGPENYVAQGFVNHNTGIGKGRVNAAIIKWAMKKGRIPIFTTEKPGLYADMFRDMTDIGMEPPRIFATNAGLTMPLDDANKNWIRTQDTKKHNGLMMMLNDPEKFRERYDVVFTNYSQMQTLKGESTERRRFLSAIIPSSTIIFDESHNAGGNVGGDARKPKNTAMDRAGFARDLVKRANGVFYSSATYAKRPDVMSLYAATDMAMAVDDINSLGEAISKGGIPMQQVVAAQLAKAGQYIRRERSFHGINYNTPSVDVNHDTYDQISHALAAIQEFSQHVKGATKAISNELKAEAAAVGGNNATGDAGASSTTFSSKMHNIINQMLLAMKAPEAAKMAIQHIRNGEKPVLTVANTMEAFLKDYADEIGLNPGDPMEADFADVLMRYLERSRRITIKKAFSKDKAQHHVLTDEELGPDALNSYNDTKALIAGMDLSHLPISPIDHIKDELAKAGYDVGEITGRGLTVDYSGKQPTLKVRPGAEITTKGRNEMRRRFNLRPEKGGLHAIIINQAGSTGISMHAGEKFDDKSKRRMMIVQPEGNIDTHMQLLGRVNRTGQVVLPEYDQLVANIPAEKRPAAVLAKKMASLNANTTASRTSAVTAKDVPDFMNQYGDLVAAGYLNDNLEMNERLAWPVKPGEGALKAEDAMRKLTGRIPLLPLKQQEELYAHLEEEYSALIKQMEASGTSPLEAKTLDLKARTLETSEVQGQKNGSGSPFAAPVNVEKASVLRQGKPFTPAELVSRLTDKLGIEKPEDPAKWASQFPREIAGREAMAIETIERQNTVKRFEEYVRPILNKIDDVKAQESERNKLNTIKDRWTSIHSLLPIGARVRLNMVDANPVAVVLDVKQTSETKNPLALGSWKVNFAVADATRQITLPFSRLFLQGQANPESMLDVEVVHTNETPADTLARFQMMQSGAREDRYIATGNLLAAYDWLNMKGAIINYTDTNGAVHQGILTPKDFKLGEHAIKKGRIVADPTELKTLLDQNQTVWSKDRQVNVSRADRWSDNYQIQTEKKKATGGRYYLDPELTKLTGDFYSRGGMMSANVPGKSLDAAIKRLQELGAQFTVAAAAPKPEKVESPEPPPDDEPPGGGSTLAQRAALTDRSAAASMSQQHSAQLEGYLRAAVNRIAGPGVKVEFNRGFMNVGPGSAGYTADVGQQAAGTYHLGQDLIRLALLRGKGDQMLTAAFHEAYHHVEARLQTEQERKLMEQETSRLREWIKGKTGLRDDQVDGLAGYEVRAIAFQSYANERANAKPKAGDGLHIMVRRWFDRLWEAMRQLGNGLRGLGFKTYNDIFNDAYTGEFAKREPSATINLDPNSMAMRAEADSAVTSSLRDVMSKATLWNKFRERAQDLNEAVDRLQNAVEARMDGEIPDSKAFYQKKRLFPGKVATEVQDFNKQHLDPLVDLLKKKGLSLDDIGDIVYAQHAEERNAYIDTINPDALGAGSGMTNEEAQDILNRYLVADLAEISGKVDGIRDFILDQMVRSGLESRTTTDAWRAQYRHYAPLGGFAEPREDDLNDTFRESGKFNVRGREVKQALGRRSKADNPLINLLDQAYRTIERGKKNEYLQALARSLLGLDPDDRQGFVQFDRGKPRRELDPVTGLVRSVDDSSFRFSPNAVAYKVNGRTHYMVFDQRPMAEVLKRMHPDALNGVGQALLTMQNKLKSMWTHYSPEFLIRHFMFRYPIEGTINSFEQGNVPRYMADSIPFLGRASKAIFASQRGEVHSDPEVAQYQRYWDEQRKAGGAIAFRQMRDIDMTRDHLDRRLQALTGRPLATVRDKARAIAETMDTVTNALDNSLRLAAYAEARRQGKTPEQAAVIARDATVDYQQAGKWKNFISLIWPFTNVAAQTGARMASAVTRSRTMRTVFASTVAAGFASAMFNYLIGGNDTDGIPFFDKMPWWQKQLNLTVMNPMHRDDKGRPVPIHIPLPYNWAFPFTIGQALATMAFSKTRGEARKAIAAVVKSGVSAFSPFAEDENQVANISPELLKPLVHAYTNENWTGYPVHRDAAFQKGPRSESGHKTTGEGWKFAASMANAASGGDKHHSGYLDFFPEDLREVTKYYSGLGTLFDLGLHTRNTVENAVGGKPTDYSKIPLARVVMGTDYDAANRSRRFDNERLSKRPWER